jgi:hypothetical protein
MPAVVQDGREVVEVAGPPAVGGGDGCAATHGTPDHSKLRSPFAERRPRVVEYAWT